MNIGVVVQARMSSQRLPGKVLMPLAGRPVIGWLVERLSARKSKGPIVVATSTSPSDDQIERFCHREMLKIYRGSLANVAGRLLATANASELDYIIRVSADSPLLDPAVVDRAVGLVQETQADLITNVFPRSFPKGQSVEILRVDALRDALNCLDTNDEHHLEHVTTWFYHTSGRWNIHNFAHHVDVSAVQLSIDTAEDWMVVNAMLKKMDGPLNAYDVDRLVELHANTVRVLRADRA